MAKANQRQGGYTLIEVIISLSILAIVMLSAASIMRNFATQSKQLNYEIVVAEQKSFLDSVLTSAEICSCQIDPAQNTAVAGALNINTTLKQIPDIEIGSLRAGCDFTSATNLIAKTGAEIGSQPQTLNVTSVKLANIRATGKANEYTGAYAIQASSPDGKFNRIISSLIRFNVNAASGSPTQRPLAGCVSSSSGGGESSCPANFTLIGPPGSKNAFCIENQQRPAQDYFSAMQNCRTVQYPSLSPAHLCFSNEYDFACANGQITGGQDLELTDDVRPVDGMTTGAPVVYLHSRTFCGENGNQYPLSQTAGFRCCI